MYIFIYAIAATAVDETKFNDFQDGKLVNLWFGVHVCLHKIQMNVREYVLAFRSFLH